eukprot:1890639-Pyramimonas_sp.AAC.1
MRELKDLKELRMRMRMAAVLYDGEELKEGGHDHNIRVGVYTYPYKSGIRSRSYYMCDKIRMR